MALQPPPNYPRGSTDEQIEQMIDDVHREIFEARGDINKVVQLQPLALSGQNELTQRYLRRTGDDAAATNRRALRLSRYSLAASILAAVLSVVAALFAWEATSSSSRWEARQVPILEQLRDETVGLRADLREQTKLLDAAAKASEMASKGGSSPAKRRK